MSEEINGTANFWNGFGWALIWISISVGIGSCQHLIDKGQAEYLLAKSNAELISAEAKLLENKLEK